MRAGLGGISLVITKNAKISMATCIGLFLARSTCPMWVSWKVFAVTKAAWLLEAPFVWNTEHLQLPQQGKREIGESPMGFSLSRLEGVHGTSAHIKLARTSHIASPCVAIDVP